MRELHIEVPERRHADVASVLDDRGVDFTTFPVAGEGDGVVFLLPLPTAAVSPILDDLAELGVDEESYTVVTKAEAVETAGYDDLRERYADTVGKLSTEELHAKIREIQWPYQLYYLGTILSVFAAAAGLLLDQPALIIGAMIIAPQASSALAAPVGVLLSDWEIFVESTREQLLGLGIAVVGAALFGWFVRWTGFVPSPLAVTSVELVGVRLAPTFLSTVGAVVAGVVGAFGYTTEQSTALVGVMVAASLIPSAAAAGLAVAWGTPLLAAGSILLLLVNLLAINIGAFLTLVAMGYEPDWLSGGVTFRESIPSDRRLAVYATLVVLLVATVGTGYATGTNVAFARSTNEAVEATLDGPEYRSLSLSGVRIEYVGLLVDAEPTDVTVRVSRPTDRAYPDLARRLEERVERRTGQDVTATVAFTESLTANETDPAG